MKKLERKFSSLRPTYSTFFIPFFSSSLYSHCSFLVCLANLLERHRFNINFNEFKTRCRRNAYTPSYNNFFLFFFFRYNKLIIFPTISIGSSFRFIRFINSSILFLSCHRVENMESNSNP